MHVTELGQKKTKKKKLCQLNVQALGVNCCPKPEMSTTRSKKPLYLVSVTKFTNLSGNQVPLVLLHVNSVYVILRKNNALTG